MIAAYIKAAGIQLAPDDAPLFPATVARTRKLSETTIQVKALAA